MTRTARAAAELVSGGSSLRGLVRRAGDPEAYGDSPQRTRLWALTERIELVESAKARLDRGEPVLAADEVGTDPILDEIAAAEGQRLSREEIAAMRATALTRAVSDGKVKEALEAYLSLASLYLDAPTAGGDSVHRAHGRRTLTAQVNGWIMSGLLRNRGQLVLVASDLERLAPKLLKVAAKLSSPEVGGAAIEVDLERVEQEVTRLRAFEATPSHQRLLEGGVGSGHALYRSRLRGKRLGRFARGMLRLIDDPGTLAMVLAGAVAGSVGRLLMSTVGSAAVSAGGVDVGILGRTLTKRTVGRFVATRAVEGAAFHAGMNAFEIARDKSDRASWDIGSFLRSIAVMELLGGAHLRQHALYIKNAVLRHAVGFGEETLALSLLGLGEVYLEGGDANDLLELMQGNLQFLVAMRLLSGGQWALRGMAPEPAQAIRAKLAEAKQELRALKHETDPRRCAESARRGCRLYADHLAMLTGATADLHRDGSVTAAKPRPRRHPRAVAVNEPGLKAVVDHLAEVEGRSRGWREAVKASGAVAAADVDLVFHTDEARLRAQPRSGVDVLEREGKVAPRSRSSLDAPERVAETSPPRPGSSVQVGSDRVRPLITSEETKQATVDLIKSADHSLYVTTHAIDDPDYIHEITAAADRGVSVYVAVSDPRYAGYSRKRAQGIRERLEKLAANRRITILDFPNARLQIGTTVFLPELHTKLVIADGGRAYLGDSNLKYHGETLGAGMILQGPSAKQLSRFFLELWSSSGGEVDRRPFYRMTENPELQILNSRVSDRDIKTSLLEDINGARDSIFVMQYALTDPDVIAALTSKRRRDPSVRIEVLLGLKHGTFSLPGLSVRMPLNMNAYRELRRAGVDARFAPEERFVHGKLALIDGEITHLGSADFTYRSLEGNLETNARVVSREISDHFSEHLRAWHRESSAPALTRRDAVEIAVANRVEGLVYFAFSLGHRLMQGKRAFSFSTVMAKKLGRTLGQFLERRFDNDKYGPVDLKSRLFSRMD